MSRPVQISTAILFLCACAIWLPALETPFWGDDYVFLQDAHAANLRGAPWWAAFWPQIQYKFWRPLSQESFWRLVDSLLGGDPLRGHFVNLGLLVVSAVCVGLLGLVVARICSWPQPGGVAVLGGAIFACLALHLLPVHWVAAANSSILVILTASILAVWIAAPEASRGVRPLLWATIPCLLIAALLSKESAALLPLLMVVLTAFVAPRARPGRAGSIVLILCCIIVAIWWVIHGHFTAGTDPQYDLVFGVNLLRNGGSLVAWLLNVPRESLRMLASGETVFGALWAGAALVLAAGAWGIAARLLARGLDRTQWLAATAFVVIAYAPYFPLAWNSYAYYAAVAAILPTLLLARGLVESRSPVLAVLSIGLSSLISVQGTRALDHPGLIGRARWAESTFRSLGRERITHPLLVRPADPQRFYAMGTAGLAWRLGLAPQEVRIVETCPEQAVRCLVIAADGRWQWERP